MNPVWDTTNRKGSELLVILAIDHIRHMEDTPTVDRLAELTRLSKPYTKRIISKLEAAGEIDTDLSITNDAGYVYIVKSGIYYKIGFSVNPRQRLKTIKTSQPLFCELVYTHYSKKAKYLESTLHSLFDSKRMNGEWFTLSDTDLISIRNLLD